MFTQNRIIFFCYSYIVGLVMAMVWPLDPAALPWLQAVTAAAVLATALWVIRERRAARLSGADGGPRPERILWWLLLASAFSLGYTRYISANTVPDTMVGEVRLARTGATYRSRASLPDTCRLRIVKTSPLSEDAHVRLRGELDARVPARDDDGLATVDREGRWQFKLATVGLTSDVITVRAIDPVGTDYVVPQPLTRLDAVDVLDGPPVGALSLYRVSNHAGSFVAPGGLPSPVTVLGRISADPLVYDFKTVLPITPEFIQYPAGGPFFHVEGGDIQVTIRPEMKDYEQFARTEAYGCDVELSGELTVARAAANPGGFNARRFMQNYNVFGLMMLYAPREGPPPIHLIKPVDGDMRQGNALVEFSLHLRDRILVVIKQTMLFPQSAFVGGVTLGLRYGLQGVECMFSKRYHHVWHGLKSDTAAGRYCEETIADEFKTAGVNHVLAVSGLHVTIITVMFVGIFSLVRIPRQAYVPVIILALVVFAIITGARPSTLRAVIMNSLFLLSWAYLDQSLRSSVLIGVPVAAFLILLHNPLVVVDPSFTLSFGAILSLGLLTTPSLDMLQKLRGNQFVLFLLVALGGTLLAMRHWALVVSPQFYLPVGAMIVVLFLIADRLQRRGWGVPETVNYSLIPEGVGAFFAAQFAIQLGMMMPLSALYFCRWPFAGAYANLIAIPLIGVVVQLGAIGGLLGLIPGVGPYVALLLGAANWVFSSFFLWLAHASAEAFPYPFVHRPGLLFIAVYYLGCAWFVWRQPVWAWLVRTCDRVGLRFRHAPGWVAGVAGAVLLALLLADVRAAPPQGLRVTFLSVGYGSSALLETPGGKRILIDAGYVEHERGRRNEATRTVLPFLANNGIRHLDALILTSPRPERAAGISYVLDQTWVDYFFVPPSLTNLVPAMSFDDFTGRFVDALDYIEPSSLAQSYEELVGNASWPRRPAMAVSVARRHPTLLNRWGGWDVRYRGLEAGQALFEEDDPGGVFRIEVLNPVGGSPAARDFDDGSLVLRVVYGDFAMLFTGDLQYEGVEDLAQRYPADRLQAQLLVMPHHAAAVGQGFGAFKPVMRRSLGDQFGPLLDKVHPERVIAEWGNPRPVLGDNTRDVQNAYELTRQFVTRRLGDASWLSTDTDLAIQVSSDGSSYQVQTQAEANRAEGGEEDAVSDLAVGL